MTLLKRLFPERHLIVPIIVASGWFMQQMDSTILATALPTISHAFHEDPLRLNLAITTYMISLAVFVPLSGWCCDRWGARRVFQAALIIFAVSSMACGMADSLLELVLARIVQGLGGAMMMPVGRLLVLQNSPRSDMARAMSYLTIPAMMGPILGPPIGGFIVTYASWRWIFYINVPAAILGLILTGRYIANVKEKVAPRLDVVGCVLSGLGLAGLVFAFEVGGRNTMPLPLVLGMVAVGVICGGLYIRHSRRVVDPIVDLSLLKIPSVGLVVSGGTLFRMGIGSLPFLMPLMLQLGFGLPPLQSGLITFASALGSLFMKTSIPGILKRYGFRKAMTYNAVICCAFALTNCFFTPSTPHLLIFLLMLAGGFFRSLEYTGLSVLSYADVPTSRMNRATTLNTMTQQISNSLGVGVGAMILNFTLLAKGETALTAGDFPYVFAGISMLSLSSVYFFTKIPADAGMEVSGHRVRGAAPIEIPVAEEHA